MDSKDTPENNQPPKEKVLPTYVFGDDYKQTVNLSKNGKAIEEPEPTHDEEKPAEQPKLSKEEQDELLNESISTELEKLNSEKKPISMIVNKKKFRVRFLVIIFFIAAIGLGSLWGISIMLDQGVIGKQSSKRVASGISMEDLVCEMEGDNSELLGTGNALVTKSTVRVSYVNGDFVSLTQIFEARFENYSNAKIALNNARANYVKRFKNFGIATEPFESDYDQNGESITVTHRADAANINKDNAGVVYINVNPNGVVIYEIESIKKNYQDLGYACSIE